MFVGFWLLFMEAVETWDWLLGRYRFRYCDLPHPDTIKEATEALKRACERQLSEETALSE